MNIWSKLEVQLGAYKHLEHTTFKSSQYQHRKLDVSLFKSQKSQTPFQSGDKLARTITILFIG